jgi:predicted Zn-dependent protease
VSHAQRQAWADRKALLRARAELDRSKVALAALEVRSIVAPPPSPLRMARVRPGAAMMMSLVAPMLGASRVTRLLRFVSLALMAVRVARSWR